MHLEEVNLKHELTEGELASLAKQQSHALGKKAAAEAELAAIKKDFGGRIALAQAEVQNCSQSINTGWEMRNVKCILADERPEGWRLVIRVDNGHISKRRKLDPSERQMKLGDQAQAREYVASALLLVDDEDWKEADVAMVPLYQDEYDMLKSIPSIKFGPPPGQTRRIEAPAVENSQADRRGRGRPRKNK